MGLDFRIQNEALLILQRLVPTAGITIINQYIN